MADADVAAAPSLESCWPDAAVSVEGGCSSGSTEEEPEIARRRSILLCAERCDGDVKDDNEEELANAAAPTMVPVSCRRDGTDLLRPMSTSLFCSLLDGRVSWREMRGLFNAHPCQNSGFITSLLKKSFMEMTCRRLVRAQRISADGGQIIMNCFIRSRRTNTKGSEPNNQTQLKIPPNTSNEDPLSAPKTAPIGHIDVDVVVQRFYAFVGRRTAHRRNARNHHGSKPPKF